MKAAIAQIEPLWETFPTRNAQETAESGEGGSMFAEIFRSAIDNVRRRRTWWPKPNTSWPPGPWTIPPS